MQTCQCLHFSLLKPIVNFWPPELLDNKFMLFWATKFVKICYNNKRKLKCGQLIFRFLLLLFCSNINIIFSLKTKVKTKIKMSIHFIWAIEIYNCKSNNFPIIFLLMTWHSIRTWQRWWEKCWLYKHFLQLLSILNVYSPIVTSGNGYGYPLVEAEDTFPHWLLRVGSL